MTREQQSHEKLRKASNHLHYEIWMFQSLAQGMASGIAGNGVINNSLLESFAIHLRALLYFFYPKRNPDPDDVIAEDFFETPEEWSKAIPAKSQLLQEATRRVNKEIVHLTYSRQAVTPEQKLWMFVDLMHDLNPTINSFLTIVPEHLLGSRWEEHRRRVDKGDSGILPLTAVTHT